MSVLRKLAAALAWLENLLIAGSLAAMVLLAVWQIVQRNVFGSSVIWIEPLLQHLVLWIAMLGGMIASRNDGHIRIDLISHYLSPFWLGWLNRLLFLFVALLCGAVAWHSLLFVQEEYQQGTRAFAQMPSWLAQSVVTLGFSVIALRYALKVLMPKAAPAEETRS